MKERGYFANRMAARRAVQRGFPAPYELGPNTLAWDLDEVEKYDETRPRRLPGGFNDALPKRQANVGDVGISLDGSINQHDPKTRKPVAHLRRAP